MADRLAERRALGEDVWTYVCWEPGEPYLNLYINMQGIQHRLIFWQNYLLGANGFLYWSSNYWDRISDPWESGVTVNWLSDRVYGDGALLYNGSKVGVDGPCSSLRLEAVRDGVDVDEFIAFAKDHPRLTFLVTRIGCGIAGFTDAEISPLFKQAHDVDNIVLPPNW